jgi:hypothetical protein
MNGHGPQRGGRLRDPRRLAVPFVVLAVPLVLAACSDGYPSGDAEGGVPASMTSRQVVAHLNRFGRHPELEARRRYRLPERCVRIVVTEQDERRQDELRLRDVRVDMSFDPDVRVHAVRVLDGQAGPASVRVAFASPRWADAVRVRRLVERPVEGCAR